ncbi:hypothetical protein [Paenibacillus popilliae]|uniref:Uncharacterized conserved protein n=1 Tax=Paenibacillus popilliae ATCC 14706 TaxID=1212764 RepID=M9LYS0_PAEPP|nr:hypothetical protein [Paenibacillus popilliae]GAC41314.1 uncharacterized conserved protein [Paenibacillus popilliae ATCC 14706]
MTTSAGDFVLPGFKELALKVWTPIMSFVLFLFSMIAVVIFKAKDVSETFSFDFAIWVWIFFAIAFTPLCGYIMWHQTVKIMTGQAKPKKIKTKKKKEIEATEVS